MKIFVLGLFDASGPLLQVGELCWFMQHLRRGHLCYGYHHTQWLEGGSTRSKPLFPHALSI